MLSAVNRLSLRQYRDAFKINGHRISNPFFTLVYIKEDMSLSRFTVLITKKVHPRSHKRHYLKRLFHNLLRQHLAQIPTGFSFLIIPKNTALSANKEILENELLKVINEKVRVSLP